MQLQQKNTLWFSFHWKVLPKLSILSKQSGFHFLIYFQTFELIVKENEDTERILTENL